MSNKKYQIFISSTYKDLKEERKEAIKAILNMGQLPCGMELFCASDNEQFEYIKKVIDDSDYYILILALCYGTKNPKTGISYTEMEYQYALEKKMPIIVLFSGDNYNPKIKDNNQKKINAFRKKVLDNNKLAKSWNNSAELVSGIISSLHNAFDDSPQNGWVRLSKTNSKIKKYNIDETKDYIIDFYPQVQIEPTTKNYFRYEKYKSGKITQQGNIYIDSRNALGDHYLNFPITFESDNYSFFYNIIDYDINSKTKISIKDKKNSYVILNIRNLSSNNKPICLSWFANGF